MRLKKAFAVILAIAMVFGAVSLAAAATPVAGGFADAAENKQANEVAYLKALGIAKGDENGNFNPDAALTRQEFVTFVARLAGQESAAEFMGGIASRYLDDADIADWARGPVNLADTNGWVQGYDDGKFHPTDTLTFAQAVTVLVRVLGHEPQVTGGYPNGYIIKGINLTLNTGVSLAANTPISRADMGRLLYNALFIPQAKKTADGWEDGDTLLEKRTAEGTVTAVSTSNITVDGLGQRAFADEVTIIGDVSGLPALQGLTVRVTSASDISKSGAKVDVVQVIDAAASGMLVVKEVKVVNDASTGFKPKNFIFFEDDLKVEYNGDTTYSLNGSAPVQAGAKYQFTEDTNTDPNFTLGPTVASVVKKGDWVVASESGGVAKHLQVYSWDAVSGNAANNQVLSKDGAAQTESTNKDRIELESTAVVATAGASIVIDGVAAQVTDLKKSDVVSVAFKMEWVINDDGTPNDDTDDFWEFAVVKDGQSDNVAFHVEAHRNVIQGEVIKIVAGATTKRTLKLDDGTTKELTDASNASGTGNAVLGATVRALLDGKGNVAHYATVTGPEAAVKVVRATGLTVIQESGKSDSYALAANRAGEAENVALKNSVKIGGTTYDLTKTAAGDGRNEFITALGTSNYWEVQDNGGELVKINVTAITGTIVAIDAANNKVTLKNKADSSLSVTVKGFAAYKTGATGAYVKFEDLKVSDTEVTYYNVSGETALIILP